MQLHQNCRFAVPGEIYSCEGIVYSRSQLTISARMDNDDNQLKGAFLIIYLPTEHLSTNYQHHQRRKRWCEASV